MKYVGSPIEQATAAKMSDAQWISAMRKYAGTTDTFRGGPVELSGMLGEFARLDLDRFAALIEKIPDDIDPTYFSAILDGLCSNHVNLGAEEKKADGLALAAIPTDFFLAAIERLHDLPKQPCGSAIVGCIQKLADRSLPVLLLDIVSFYAMNDPDPESDIWKETRDGLKYHDGNPHFHGINCVRGQSAECLGALLFADESRLPYLRSAMFALAADRAISVRACAINAILPLVNFEPDAAVKLFLSTCNRSDSLCSSHPFERFVNCTIHTHYIELRELLQFALNSQEPKAVENAATQIILAELWGVDVGLDAMQLRKGSEAMRKAAAHVYARNLTHADVGDQCATYLREFFNDVSAAVREEVSMAYFYLAGSRLLYFKDFIADYIESLSFENGTNWLLDALSDSNVELPQVVCRAAERIFQFVGEEGSHIADREARVAYGLAKLVVRQYEQAKDAALKTHCLDLIDRMEQIGYMGVAEELERLDR